LTWLGFLRRCRRCSSQKEHEKNHTKRAWEKSHKKSMSRTTAIVHRILSWQVWHWLNTAPFGVMFRMASKFYLKIHILSPASTSFLTTGTTVRSESFHALLIELLK
jgi:hypothetical protein